MASGKKCENRGRTTLLYMLSFPVMVTIMWAASPNNFHWHHTACCTTSGCVIWVILGICGLCRYIEPWRAVILTLEVGFGLVPMVYLLFDMHSVGAPCFQKAHQARVFASIPVVLMAKQLGRTIVDTMSEGDQTSTWWHLYVDSLEMLVYFIFGWLNYGDLGELWFLIYCGSPVALSSLLFDHLVQRLSTLHRANDRLMQTAFVAVVRVDGLAGGSVSESNPRFDILVDGQAKGMKLGNFFTATKSQLDKLCSPSIDSERVVRRLRTTLVGMSQAFQQDVELRVLSATEDELHNERGLLLGVSIMGERLPFTDWASVDTSCLLEQHVDDVGDLRLAEELSTKIGGTLAEEATIDCDSAIDAFDSVSCAGLRQRRRRRRGSCSTRTESTVSDELSTAIPPREFPKAVPNHILGREESFAYPHPWKESSSEYLKECSMSMLEDLVSSWNYSHANCCHWHEAVSRLSKLVEEMTRWHVCDGQWPKNEPVWQCSACSSLAFDEHDQCWLCYSHKNAET